MKQSLLICLSILMILSACSRSQQWPPSPAEVHLGDEKCAACGMIISDERFGAQLHIKGKPVEFFDDYGCMFHHAANNHSANQMIYVRSAETAEWIPEGQAVVVISKQISSPMGYGIAAFESRDSAVKFAHKYEDSKLYSTSELIRNAENILREAAYKKE